MFINFILFYNQNKFNYVFIIQIIIQIIVNYCYFIINYSIINIMVLNIRNSKPHDIILNYIVIL